MRKAFIVCGAVIFVLYCWASVVYQNQVDVPDYAVTRIDVLGGRTRAAWEADQSAQFQRLMDLEGERYQPPADDAAGNPDRALTSADFAAAVAATAGAPVMMRVRDASAFTALLDQKYVLRDSVANPDDPDGMPLYLGGRALDKRMLDDLRARGVAVITVSGHAPPVTFQAGTAVMIAVIFFTLVAALKPVVWTPFILMLEKRKRELDIGQETERQNQLEAVRYREEETGRTLHLDREIQALQSEGLRSIAKDAAAIVKTAREQERDVKLHGLRDITRAADAARDSIGQDIPELAEAIARAVTPAAAGTQEGQG